MKYEDLIKQQQLREDWSEHIENNIAMVILLDYLKKSSEHKLPYPNTGNFIEDIFQNYFKVKKTSNEKILIELMEEHKFKYSSSIHNAIYYLLGKKDELSELYIDPSLWPGVNEINNKNNKMVLNTILGTIEVFKASKLFEKDNKYIFQKKLMGQCYARTYEFLKKNKDYRAVLSYMPNFFYGGHYHAYLEKDEHVLDIASNAYYECKDSIDKIFCGETIARLSFEEVEEEFEKVKKEIPEVKGKQKLNVLTLYYDRKI